MTTDKDKHKHDSNYTINIYLLYNVLSYRIFFFCWGEMYKADLKYSNHFNHLGEKKKIPFHNKQTLLQTS